MRPSALATFILCAAQRGVLARAQQQDVLPIEGGGAHANAEGAPVEKAVAVDVAEGVAEEVAFPKVASVKDAPESAPESVTQVQVTIADIHVQQSTPADQIPTTTAIHSTAVSAAQPGFLTVLVPRETREPDSSSPASSSSEQPPSPTAALLPSSGYFEGDSLSLVDNVVVTTYYSCATIGTYSHCGWHEPVIDTHTDGGAGGSWNQYRQGGLFGEFWGWWWTGVLMVAAMV